MPEPVDLSKLFEGELEKTAQRPSMVVVDFSTPQKVRGHGYFGPDEFRAKGLDPTTYPVKRRIRFVDVVAGLFIWLGKVFK